MGRPGKKPVYLRLSALFSAPVTPNLEQSLVWPSIQDMYSSQEKFSDEYDDESLQRSSQELLLKADGGNWRHPSDTDFQYRIRINGHCGPAGHRGYETTLRAFREHFY